ASYKKGDRNDKKSVSPRVAFGSSGNSIAGRACDGGLHREERQLERKFHDRRCRRNIRAEKHVGADRGWPDGGAQGSVLWYGAANRREDDGRRLLRLQGP